MPRGRERERENISKGRSAKEEVDREEKWILVFFWNWNNQERKESGQETNGPPFKYTFSHLFLIPDSLPCQCHVHLELLCLTVLIQCSLTLFTRVEKCNWDPPYSLAPLLPHPMINLYEEETYLFLLNVSAFLGPLIKTRMKVKFWKRNLEEHSFDR